VQGLLVHGAGEGALRGFPIEGVKPPLLGAAVGLEALLEEAGDGALGRAHGPVEEEDAALGAQAVGGRFQGGHQAHQGLVQAEDGVLAPFKGVVKEAVVEELLPEEGVLLHPVGQDHVVGPLEAGP
jgi:hypothetical protein